MNDLSKKMIERQDWFCYYGLVNLDSSIGVLEKCKCEESIKYNQILEIIAKENIETLRNYSIKNLMHVLTAYQMENKDKEKILQIISEKMDNGEKFYTEEITKGFFMKQYSMANVEFSKMDKKLEQKVKEDILKRTEKVKGTNCEKLMEYFTFYTDVSNFLTYFEDGIFTDEKVSILEEIIKENQKALSHTNFAIFKDEIYGVLGKDFIKYLVKFPNLSTQIDILSKANPTLLQVISEQIQSKSDLRDNLNLISEMIKYFTNNCYNIEVKKLTKDVSKNLIDATLRNNKSKRDSMIINIPYSQDYEERLENIFKEEYDMAKSYDENNLNIGYNGKTFEMPIGTSKLDILKNIYLNKYLSMSLKEAEIIVEMYGEDVDKLKSEKGKSLIRNIKDILDFQNEEKMDFSMQHNRNSQEINDIKQELEQEYALSYTTELNKTEEELLKSNNKKIIHYQGKNIIQIEATEEFSMLVHSTDTGFINETKIENQESFKQKWKNNSSKFNHIISMSYINQDFLGMAPVGNNGVIYGFTSIDNKNIRLMGNTDINTYSNEFGYDSSQKKYLTAKSMPYNSRRVYNEFGIERKQTNPDYVLIFDDSSETNINNAYKAASDWNIPIVRIDKEKVKDRQITRLEKLRQDFEETKDPGKLQELLNTYETNMAGWLLNRKKDEQDTSFTQTINNERFRQDFEEEYTKIVTTLDMYLENLKNNKELSQDLITIMKIVLKENDLYENSDKQKPISKTQSTINSIDIIEKIDKTMEMLGMGDYTVDKDNIPRTSEYEKRISMQQFVRNALGKERITYEDVTLAENQVTQDKTKENEKNVGNR